MLIEIGEVKLNAISSEIELPSVSKSILSANSDNALNSPFNCFSPGSSSFLIA